MSEEKTIDVEVEGFIEEEKSEGLLTKAAKGLKKHGKKIVAGAVVATVGLIGYALGSKSKEDEFVDTDMYYINDSDSSGQETTETTE